MGLHPAPRGSQHTGLGTEAGDGPSARGRAAGPRSCHCSGGHCQRLGRTVSIQTLGKAGHGLRQGDGEHPGLPSCPGGALGRVSGEKLADGTGCPSAA